MDYPINQYFVVLGVIVFLSACKNAIPVQSASLPVIINKHTLVTHFKVISSNEFEGRKLGSKGGNKTSDYLVKQLISYDVPPFKGQYKHPFAFNKLNTVIQGNNVIATILGKRYPDKYIVLSAHFDHLGKKKNRVFNGADDNASGTAALLTIAKSLVKSPLEHSVIILFSDGEESNIKGSKAFAKQQANLFTDIKLNINLDMLAGNKHTKKLRFVSRRLASLLAPNDLKAFKVRQFNEIAIVKGFGHKTINKNVNWNMASDHWVFNQQGIPFIYYGVGLHNNYHKQSDTFANSNVNFFFKATNAIYQQLIFLDRTM